MYDRTTRGIRIEVHPFYLEDQSTPDQGHFVWAYRVKIENVGLEPVQLLNRYWKITDAFGRIKEVRGPGVVGEQPRLGPGETFEYTSGTPLSTPSGIMAGTYEMATDDGDSFPVVVPPFSLDSPHEQSTLN